MAEALEQWGPRKAAGLERVPGAVEASLRELAEDALESARRQAPFRSGRLRGSIAGGLRGGLDGQVTLTSSAPGAEVLEDGGTVRGEPVLAIPLREDVRAVGSPRADRDLFFLRLEDGRLFLASRDGAALDVRWRLVDAVSVQPHPFLRPAIEDASRRLPRAVLDAIARELGEA